MMKNVFNKRNHLHGHKKYLSWSWNNLIRNEDVPRWTDWWSLRIYITTSDAVSSMLHVRCSRGKTPGVEHCLHNPYKYLFFLYSLHSGVIVHSRVKRGTPTHLWNARSAFLWRTSCIPRREAKESVQLVSGMEIREFSTNIKHHKNHTFDWIKSHRFWVPMCPVYPRCWGGWQTKARSTWGPHTWA